jgi:nucleoside-diphosphate-sugar epimerase
MELTSVSVLGCGWLGWPLAQYLQQKGFSVQGSVTSQEKADRLSLEGSIPVYALALNPEPEGRYWSYFLKAEVLVVAIPPGLQRHEAGHYPKQIARLLDMPLLKQNVNHLIFISSTSVYDDTGAWVDETSPVDAQNDIVKAELCCLESGIAQVHVLRCGGLMGGSRIPGKYFAGKTGLSTAEVPVNFIHQDDAVAVVAACVEKQIPGGIYNVCAPQHPLRKDIYARNAAQFGFKMPEFITPPQVPPHKIVSPEKLLEAGYRFIWPDPLLFPYIND